MKLVWIIVFFFRRKLVLNKSYKIGMFDKILLKTGKMSFSMRKRGFIQNVGPGMAKMHSLQKKNTFTNELHRIQAAKCHTDRL